MPLVASPTELSTAATDALLAALCVLVAAWIRRTPSPARWRATLWGATLALLALASLLGAFAHGVAMAAELREALWKPVDLILGFVVGSMLVATIGDLRGVAAVRPLLPWVAAAALAFVALSALAGGAYLVFLLFQGAAAIAMLAVYTRLAWQRRLAGAPAIAAALVLNLVGGAVQASDLSLRIVVTLDHNGLYHLVVMAAVALLGRGVVAGQVAHATRIAPAPRDARPGAVR